MDGGGDRERVSERKREREGVCMCGSCVFSRAHLSAAAVKIGKYHYECLPVPLAGVPTGAWFCPACTEAHESNNAGGGRGGGITIGDGLGGARGGRRAGRATGLSAEGVVGEAGGEAEGAASEGGEGLRGAGEGAVSVGRGGTGVTTVTTESKEAGAGAGEALADGVLTSGEGDERTESEGAVAEEALSAGDGTTSSEGAGTGTAPAGPAEAPPTSLGGGGGSYGCTNPRDGMTHRTSARSRRGVPSNYRFVPESERAQLARKYDRLGPGDGDVGGGGSDSESSYVSGGESSSQGKDGSSDRSRPRGNGMTLRASPGSWRDTPYRFVDGNRQVRMRDKKKTVPLQQPRLHNRKRDTHYRVRRVCRAKDVFSPGVVAIISKLCIRNTVVPACCFSFVPDIIQYVFIEFFC